ncbi:para-nitrobenzyl esterase-like [Cylas formicarius]|uniref:para-nitrobenzyl esterase-like n=1 Tax=Cylas formicarius TaxID=197179 RepID=UPI0029586C0C|nr:para-nitrobenzyl esterase-like [Cylas formicarius]
MKCPTMLANVFLCLFLSTALGDLIVTIPDGQLQGKERKTDQNTPFYAFKGIPYAAPPIGSLRFQSPQPPQPWSGVRDATNYQSSCLEFVHYSDDPNPGPMSEDCLYLNVYTPTTDVAANLPVMVWFYGGSFLTGSGIYDYFGPDYLLDNEVIVVTLNYRLGPLGFLSTGDNTILGNAGLKDQLMALKWTRDNIHQFGGDPNKVTIFGESAGGISVGLHLLSKQSAGLFRAAICQSGCSLTALLFQEDPLAHAVDLAKAFNPSITVQTPTAEIRDLLQSQSADSIVNAFKQMSDQGWVGTVLEATDQEAFVTEANYGLVQSGNINQVPLILGTTSEESLGFLGSLDNTIYWSQVYDQDSSTLVPAHLNPVDGADTKAIGQLIKNAYVGENGRFSDNLGSALEYYSDNVFLRSTLKQAELQSSYTSVYLYQFSFFGTRSKNRFSVQGSGKVGHADDVSYLFKVSTYPLETDADFLTRTRICKLWTNFAKTLNPTPESDDLLQNLTWPEVAAADVKYFDIDDVLEVKSNRKSNEMIVWTNIYDTYAKRPIVTY